LGLSRRCQHPWRWCRGWSILANYRESQASVLERTLTPPVPHFHHLECPGRWRVRDPRTPDVGFIGYIVINALTGSHPSDRVSETEQAKAAKSAAQSQAMDVINSDVFKSCVGHNADAVRLGQTTGLELCIKTLSPTYQSVLNTPDAPEYWQCIERNNAITLANLDLTIARCT
jgi:hypothetical protein